MRSLPLILNIANIIFSTSTIIYILVIWNSLVNPERKP